MPGQNKVRSTTGAVVLKGPCRKGPFNAIERRGGFEHVAARDL
jgi:hypothetical protein